MVSASNPPTTARRECCLDSAALLLRSTAELLSLSTVDVVFLGATAQDPPQEAGEKLAGVSHSSCDEANNTRLVWATAPFLKRAPHA